MRLPRTKTHCIALSAHSWLTKGEADAISAYVMETDVQNFGVRKLCCFYRILHSNICCKNFTIWLQILVCIDIYYSNIFYIKARNTIVNRPNIIDLIIAIQII